MKQPRHGLQRGGILMRDGFREYLVALSRSSTCMGLDEFCRAHRGLVPHERTILRWHRRLGSSFVVYPSFAVEALGLTHLFLFVRSPGLSWRAFPYAVSAAWVSPDCTTRVLFLHAVVPAVHRERVAARLQGLDGCVFVWGSSGWEHLSWCGGNPFPPTWAVPPMRPTVQECPLIVPVVFESWGRRASLQALWDAIHARLGDRVREYVGRRCYQTNGKSHVRHALRVLSESGMFRQYVVRYRPLLNETLRLLVLTSWDERRLQSFEQRIQGDAATIVTYPTASGWLLVLAGMPGLLERVMDAGPDCVYFLRDEEAVRFRYEELFDPASSSWKYPDDMGFGVRQ